MFNKVKKKMVQLWEAVNLLALQLWLFLNEKRTDSLELKPWSYQRIFKVILGCIVLDLTIQFIRDYINSK